MGLQLFEALNKRSAHQSFHFSCNTPTARMLLEKHCQNHAHCSYSYSPFDEWLISRNAMRRLAPTLYIGIESELWPMRMATLAAHDIPVVVVGARISETSARNWARVPSVAAIVAESLTAVMARGQPDAVRFQSIGIPVDKITTTGNLKYDQTPPAIDESAPATRALASALADRWVWVAASTHHPEEELVASVAARLKKHHPRMLLVLAPRHPHRSDAVCRRLEHYQLSYKRRSSGTLPDSTTDCLVVDTIGELLLFYHFASVALVGGSIAPIGGHNPFEAIMSKCSVLVGKHTEHFCEEYALLRADNGCRVVEDSHSLYTLIETLYTHPEKNKELIQAGQAVRAKMQGSMMRTIDKLKPWIL